MDYIDNLVSDRFGGSDFFSKKDFLYKFEKIKKTLEEIRLKHPDKIIINMGVGEPDKSADNSIVDILCAEARKFENNSYADGGIYEFKEAAVDYLKTIYNIDNLDPNENIMHGIGSKPVLAMLPLCFINPGDIILMTVPGYPIIGTYSKFLGGEVYNLPLLKENNFYPDLDNIPDDILKRSKLLYLNYPNNPTGQVASVEFYEKVVDFAIKNNIFIISDLAYGSLTYDGYKPISLLSIKNAMDICIEIHSLSKSYNMTGWRLSFVVGSKKAIQLYSAIKGHTDSGQFKAIQKAGAYALYNHELFNQNCRRYSRRFDLLVDVLRDVGFDVEKPKGGFYCYVPIPKGVKNGVRFNSAEEASMYILNNAFISTVPWDDAGSFLRFSVTYKSDSYEEELLTMDELKTRLISLDLEF